jgi:hypothetical protein
MVRRLEIVDLLVLLMTEFLTRTPRGGLQYDGLVKCYLVQCTNTKTKQKRSGETQRVNAHSCNEGYFDKLRLQVRWGS